MENVGRMEEIVDSIKRNSPSSDLFILFGCHGQLYGRHRSRRCRRPGKRAFLLVAIDTQFVCNLVEQKTFLAGATKSSGDGSDSV